MFFFEIGKFGSFYLDFFHIPYNSHIHCLWITKQSEKIKRFTHISHYQIHRGSTDVFTFSFLSSSNAITFFQKFQWIESLNHKLNISVRPSMNLIEYETVRKSLVENVSLFILQYDWFIASNDFIVLVSVHSIYLIVHLLPRTF